MIFLDFIVTIFFTAQAGVCIEDRERFPSKECCRSMIEFSNEYKTHAIARQEWEIGKWDYWQMVIEETNTLHDCWDALEDVKLNYKTEITCDKLKKLKNLIGEDNYQRGIMPPPVPIWRFKIVE